MIAKTSKTGVLILAIVAGGLIYLNSNENDDGIGFMLFILLLVAGLIIPIVILLSDMVKVSTTKSIRSFVPTAIVVIIISSTLYTLNHMNKPGDIPVLIQAGYSPGVGGSGLVLRTDNTYEFFSGALISSHSTHGTYTIKDSFIFLDRANIDKLLISDKLLIKSDAKIIYQIDSSGNRIEHSTPFFINKDIRKN
ncbi:hypothetical protein [Ferruginibacter sp. HRS2-29]|uniref:hypothetical protein n=1 Tax=Ferruginibacter sp. HRS2-29 TaxID=2487334 RepID=UPI0020CD60AB|nr:hypothetical protein [Ferruginibacter sp. HRS2-29]MCP9752331.1 hypothetical protein [Ferruginibacter sp. HRS2-29]